MTHGDRVKKIRKVLGLTLEKFGEKIGMKKNSISQIENGKNALTEQVTRAICREYNVNYQWITTGKGEMFNDSNHDVIKMIDQIMSGENEFHKDLFKVIAQLDTSELLVLENIMDKVVNVLSSKQLDNVKAKDLNNLFATAPKTPEELEALCPPVDVKNNKTKEIG